MKIQTITDARQIEEGDQLLIKNAEGVVSLRTVVATQIVGGDVEFILSKKDNTFFQASMFNKGQSWVKEILIVKP